MTQHITQEQIRAAGGIVHRDGNIFFTNIDQLNAALAQPASEPETGIPVTESAPAAVSGWKLVPVDATRNQLVTGWHAIAGKLDHQSLAHLYGVMLAAAPTGEPG